MRTDKRPCGCHIESIGHMPARIAYCAMHESAFDLFAALRAILSHGEWSASTCPDCQRVLADAVLAIHKASPPPEETPAPPS